ncbi:hypothetical protein BH23ACT9_BH23ACT9_37150 [soil metagenome]
MATSGQNLPQIAGLEERRGRLVIPDGHPLTDEDVRDLRFADQR